ncbi:helix-turn-helix transcriptional regulator [Lentzea sp. NPDC004782]|uniref:helix-turn-helix domain-containing protein n=1 Tax=Lentzea sp. NPDC004782 TaxID=3154458 RepID=UPI0033A2F858
MQSPTNDDLKRLAQHLGDELRIARKARGWTRDKLRDRLTIASGDDLSLQTLGTYEQGTRSISVKRFVQVTFALDATPQQLFQRALIRTFGDFDDVHVDVNLHALACSGDPRLRRLRTWAEVQHRQSDHNPVALVRLDPPAIQTMADLSGLGPADLIAALKEL